MIEIKRAKEEDVKTLLEFSKKLNEFERRFYGNYKSFEEVKDFVRRFFEKGLKREKSIFLIAKIKGKAIGMAYGWEVKPLPFFKERRMGYIGEIWVEEKFRRKGVGKKLMEKMLEWFKERGIKWVRADVLSNNKEAIEFYKKLGFREFNKEMEIWI